jgi:hypothetical protein
VWISFGRFRRRQAAIEAISDLCLAWIARARAASLTHDHAARLSTALQCSKIALYFLIA